jgi:hypothetical protein
MYALDLKRCPHCAAGLASLAVEDDPAPVLVCRRCDGPPHWERAIFVPRSWSEPPR